MNEKLGCYLFLCLVILCQACELNNPGDAPKRGAIYFPTSIAIWPLESEENAAAKYLLVINSNFDLAYNSGSIQAYDLDALDCEIDQCKPDSSCEIATSGPHRKRCGELLTYEVLIGSYAAGIAFSPDGSRLYVPTHGESSLTYVDIQDSGKLLDCGQNKDGGRCDSDHKRGDEQVASARDVTMPGEAVGVISGLLSDFYFKEEGEREVGSYVMVAHRRGLVSLFLDETDSDGYTEKKSGPQLIDVRGGFTERVTGIDYDSDSKLVYLTNSGAGELKELNRVGVAYQLDDPSFGFIYNAGSNRILGLGVSRDSWDLKFTEAFPGKAFVVSHTPDALAVVDLKPNLDNPGLAVVEHSIEVGIGASKLTLGQIGDDSRLFAFVSCFDSRQLFIIDIELGIPVSIIRGFSGPFELVLDRWRKRLYVTDFRSSSVRIVDLAPLVCVHDSEQKQSPADADDDSDPIPCQSLEGRSVRIMATLGKPHPPQELL